jgi:DNA ligase D-like protein (predicted ligase)
MRQSKPPAKKGAMTNTVTIISGTMTRVNVNLEIPFTRPMECLPVNRLPEGSEWVYELKLDGYRAQAIRDKNGVHLLSRNGKSFSRKFPLVFAALEDALPIGTALDGELVGFDEMGQPSFNALQNAGPDANVVFFAFDVLESEGKDVKKLPLRARKTILKLVLAASDRIQCSDHFAGPLAKFTEAVKEIGGEGIVAKRLDAPYEPDRRSGSWSKMRLNIGQEFVIGGFTTGSHGIDALVVGFYSGDELMYAARVRAGLVPVTRRELYARVKPLIVELCPFSNLPESKSGRWGQGLTAAKMKDCVWAKPKLVANFEFLEWTDTNHVRHIKFVGLRSDKNPRQVVPRNRRRLSLMRSKSIAKQSD